MDSYKDAVTKIEKMIRASRLNDLDSLMKVGQAQRVSEIEEAVSKLDPGGYLVGCGPYTQGIYRLSASETIFGRQATLHEDPIDKPLDFSLNDAVTFRPREVSRKHFKITFDQADSQPMYFITDLGSTCGTYLNTVLLEGQKNVESGVDTSVARPLADSDIISLGSGMVNLFLFLIITKS
ncbi:MAG TPA: FHA domain-containing protein [Candidatus Acidoferrales bacterium]|jgi:pSer/pThr/pTyr-binding forkhead associated (FHA) protein|nr:FHA domain-containing protein [Candidatus Acidoferrales bacterium]